MYSRMIPTHFQKVATRANHFSRDVHPPGDTTTRMNRRKKLHAREWGIGNVVIMTQSCGRR
jgi:hypothetical protein